MTGADATAHSGPAPDHVGLFRHALLRNNAEIRHDRAESLADDAETLYRRQIQDLELELRQLRREQEDLLDLSPTHADSLVLATDFDAEVYVARDLALSVRMRNTEIKYSLASTRYRTLFGNRPADRSTDPPANHTNPGD